jgi:hypothetical protein
MGDADMRLSGESGSSTLQSREVAVLRNHGYARGTEYRRQTMLTDTNMVLAAGTMFRKSALL